MKDRYLSISKFLIGIYFMLLYLIFIFSRSFLGIYIFGFRIGEYLVAFSVFCTFFTLIYFKKNILSLSDKKILKIFWLMILYFLLSTFFRRESFLNPELYKHSSFLWSIFYIFLGIFISKYFQINKNVAYFLNLNLLLAFYLQLIYFYNLTLQYGGLAAETRETRILSTTGNRVLDFFILYSDKFETYKGTGFLLFFVLITFLNNVYSNKSIVGLSFFYLASGMFIPVFLIRSRTAAVVAIFYVLIQIFKFKNYFIKDMKKNIMLSFLFIISFYLSTSLLYEKEVTFQNSTEVINYLTLERNAPQGTRKFLEYENGRLYSGDGNLNWRLQIWQDVISDLKINNKLIFGYGFSNEIPAMENSLPGYFGRTGLDGLNKGVHNFVINMLARGGVIIILLYFMLLFYILKSDKFKYTNANLKFFVLPLLFASLFDVSMENVHFPMFLYLYIGIHLSRNYDYD